jgi:hypothetical protein
VLSERSEFELLVGELLFERSAAWISSLCSADVSKESWETVSKFCEYGSCEIPSAFWYGLSSWLRL